MRIYIFYASAVPRTDYPGEEGRMHIPSLRFSVNAAHLRDAYRFALDKALEFMDERGYILDRLCFVGCFFEGHMTDACEYEDKIIERQNKK